MEILSPIFEDRVVFLCNYNLKKIKKNFRKNFGEYQIKIVEENFNEFFEKLLSVTVIENLQIVLKEHRDIFLAFLYSKLSRDLILCHPTGEHKRKIEKKMLQIYLAETFFFLEIFILFSVENLEKYKSILTSNHKRIKSLQKDESHISIKAYLNIIEQLISDDNLSERGICEAVYNENENLKEKYIDLVSFHNCFRIWCRTLSNIYKYPKILEYSKILEKKKNNNS